jgi:phosphomannomutase
MAIAPDESTNDYCCPGQTYPISRAIHLGRLADFYPVCRTCPRRVETATLPPSVVRRLAEAERRPTAQSPLFEEGAAGAYPHELDAATARRLASAMGIWLGVQEPRGGQPPVVVLAGDGRDITAELIAAAADGLCWAGCHVIDIGTAGAACTASAVGRLGTAGGLLVGNPPGQARTVGMKFWARQSRPLSAGSRLEALEELYRQTPARPTRRAGSVRRYPADDFYLAGLEEYYHALRPLRFVLDSTCPPFMGYVERLTRPVACLPIPRHVTNDRWSETVRDARAHFGLAVDDDGECGRVFDERGRPVPAERLLLLLARYSLADSRAEAAPLPTIPRPLPPADRRLPTADCPLLPIVIEPAATQELIDRLGRLGAPPINGGPRRADMERAVRQTGAVLGGGPSGRFWYRREETCVAADALVTLTLLLSLLSRSDRPLSEVVDAAWGKIRD